MNTSSTDRSISQRHGHFASETTRHESLSAGLSDRRVAAAHAKILGETSGDETKEDQELPFTD